MKIIVPDFLSAEQKQRIANFALQDEIMTLSIKDTTPWLFSIAKKIAGRYAAYRLYERWFLRKADNFKLLINGKPLNDPIKDAHIVLAGWNLTSNIFNALLNYIPDVQWVHSMRAGIEWADVRQLRQQNVVLTNSSGLHSERIAEFIIACIGDITKHISEHVMLTRKRKWREINAEYIRSKSIGILGAGSIGSAVAKKAKALDMHVMGYDAIPIHNNDFNETYGQERLHEMLGKSDFIVICLPLTPKTKSLIGQKAFSAMKKSAYIINVGRPRVIDEHDLIQSIKNKHIAGAVLDVYHPGMISPRHPFYEYDNIILTHYSAHASETAEDEIFDLFINNLNNYFLKKQLINQVNLIDASVND